MGVGSELKSKVREILMKALMAFLAWLLDKLVDSSSGSAADDDKGK